MGEVAQVRGGRRDHAWGQWFVLRCICMGDYVYMSA